MLVTKGDLFHQEAKLAASGLGDRFSGIEIVSDKKPATFAAFSSAMALQPPSPDGRGFDAQRLLPSA